MTTDAAHSRYMFETVQLLVATCGQAAYYGTVLTPHRFYVEWKTTYPQNSEALARTLNRKPNAQEVLFEGMLSRANLLDLVRNFVVFERDAKTGKTVRKVCRYQQFGAVNKAIARARQAKSPSERGGVVWHTQGSGKSLTMLWLALKLRRDTAHENPTLVHPGPMDADRLRLGARAGAPAAPRARAGILGDVGARHAGLRGSQAAAPGVGAAAGLVVGA